MTIDVQPAAAYRSLDDPVVMADFAEEFYRARWTPGCELLERCDRLSRTTR